MKEIVVPCRINGVLSTRKLYVGDGCRDDKGPVDAQVSWCAARNITFGDGVLKNIAALRDLARAQGVSFEDLVVLAYMIANKRMERRAAAAENAGEDADDDSFEDDDDEEGSADNEENSEEESTP